MFEECAIIFAASLLREVYWVSATYYSEQMVLCIRYLSVHAWQGKFEEGSIFLAQFIRTKLEKYALAVQFPIRFRYLLRLGIASLHPAILTARK